MGFLDATDLTASYYTLSGAPVFEPARHPFADRVAAAAAAGFTGLGTTVEDVAAIAAAGLSRAGMREVLAEHGVEISELEGLGAWERGESRDVEEELYELADAFGARRLNVGVIELDGAAPVPRDELVARFAELCDRAAEHDVVVGLEPLVLGSLRTPAEAAAVVAEAARPNGGVLLDSYHLFRGPGPLEDLLAGIVPEQVVAVQINDALAEPRGSVFDDCCAYRLVPGEGEQPLVAFLAALGRMGVSAPIAVELMAEELRSLPVGEAAERIASSTRAVLARAAALA